MVQGIVGRWSAGTHAVGYGTRNVPATFSSMRQLIKNAQVVLPDGIERVSVVIDGETNRGYRPGGTIGRRRNRRCQRPPSFAWRDRRSGALSRAWANAQRGFGNWQSRVCQRRHHDISRDAKYEAGNNDTSEVERKARAGGRQVPRELWLLYRGHARQSRRVAAGRADAGDQDFHRFQHGRSARR